MSRARPVARHRFPTCGWHRPHQIDESASQCAGESGGIEANCCRGNSCICRRHPDGSIAQQLFAVQKNQLHTTPCEAKWCCEHHAQLHAEVGQASGNRSRFERNLHVPSWMKSMNYSLLAQPARLLPIVKVDGKPVNGGKPGAVTRRLQGFIRRCEAFLK